MYLFNHLKKSSPNHPKLATLGKKKSRQTPGGCRLALGAEDQIVIYHFLDGTGGVDPEAAAPGIFWELKKT